MGDGWIMRFLVSCIRKIQSSISLYRRLAKGGYGEEDYSPAPLDQPEQVYFAQNREQACLFWCYASNCRPQEFFLSSFFNVKRGRVSEAGAVSIQFLIVAS